MSILESINPIPVSKYAPNSNSSVLIGIAFATPTISEGPPKLERPEGSLPIPASYSEYTPDIKPKNAHSNGSIEVASIALAIPSSINKSFP